MFGVPALSLPALSLSTRSAMLGAAFFCVALSVWFYRHQKKGALGGSVSAPKAAWLCFAVLYWFFICPLLALDLALPEPWRTTLLVFSVNIWIRGLIEVFMLFVTRNWRPPYGIAHDLFSLALIIATPLCLILVPSLIPSLTPSDQPLQGWDGGGLLAVGTLALSFVLETYYAVIFNQLVQGKTTGDGGVWFADATDPKFIRINRITARFNIPLYAALAFILAASWGVFS